MTVDRERGRPTKRKGVNSGFQIDPERNRPTIHEATSDVVMTPSESGRNPTLDTPSSPDTNVAAQTSSQIEEVKKNAKRSSGKENIRFIIKPTTGHPASPLKTGVIEINTFDNRIFMYADGGWREMAAW